MHDNPPIRVAHLFAPLDDALIDLLTGLEPDAWSLPTIARLWTVKDIAAHLLDGNIRGLSTSRDHFFGLAPKDEPLLDFLNRINAEWVLAMKRCSPALLVELLRHTGQHLSAHYASLDPDAPAIFPVAWAGESVSLNWMHLAREYTEKFLHQQQIRQASSQPSLVNSPFFSPFIQTFMQALPYTFRHTHAAENSIVSVCVTGNTGGEWGIRRQNEQWSFTNSGSADARVIIDPETAWQLFSKGITPNEATARVTIEGNERLALQVLQMVSVMA